MRGHGPQRREIGTLVVRQFRSLAHRRARRGVDQSKAPSLSNFVVQVELTCVGPRLLQPFFVSLLVVAQFVRPSAFVIGPVLALIYVVAVRDVRAEPAVGPVAL